MNKLPKNQHYVPQFLLRGFSTGTNNQINVFDKLSSKVFATSIRNVAAETGFYDFATESEKGSAEPLMCRIEETCAPIIDRMRTEKNISFLAHEDRVNISFFAAIQVLRVKEKRLFFREVTDRLRERLQQAGCKVAVIEGLGEITDDTIKRQSIKHLSSAPELAPHFLNKAWMLMQAPDSSPLYLSDNPVVLQSLLPREPFHGVGLGEDGVEIYLPISSELTLQFLCPKLASQIVTGTDLAQRMRWIAGIPFPVDELPEVSMSIRLGVPLPLKHENVENLNSLQVLSATRFVFAANDKFKLTHDMLLKDPSLKDSRTFRIS